MTPSAKPQAKQSKPSAGPKRVKATILLGQPFVEYLQVHAIVHNRTAWPMRLSDSNLSWGKWMTSPVDVDPHGQATFAAQGRDSSPSGTEGYVSWTLQGHPGNTVITADFNNPYTGSDNVGITCSDNSVAVSCDQTRGNEDTVNYYIG